MSLFRYVLLLLILFTPASKAIAENFAPEVLRLTGPPWLSYFFEGEEVSIPFTVSGTPAIVILSLFTNGRPSKIKKSWNGYLNWHYVNMPDTCIYVSAPVSCDIGDHILTWNGKDQNGYLIYSYRITYYLWAYSTHTAGIKVTDSIRINRFDRSYMQTQGSNGLHLVNPILYDAPQSFASTAERTRKIRGRWMIGSDPTNPSLLETTSYMSFAENSLLALDPRSTNTYYVQSIRQEGTFFIDKWQWITGGESVLQTDWGDSGSYSILTTLSPENALYSGPVSDGRDFLLLTAPRSLGWSGSDWSGAGIIYLDINDGTELKRLDLRTWWPDDGKLPNGPVNMSFSSNCLYLSSPRSCIMQMIDPYYTDESNSVIWVNGSGDGIGDKNFEPDSPNPWACSDSDRPTFNGTLSANASLLSAFPADGLDIPSFGLLAPDGMGLGYFPLPGMEGGRVYGLHVVDTESAYDGIYYGGVCSGGDSTGVWYSGCDTFKGSIVDSSERGINGPFISLFNPAQYDVLSSGVKTPITWHSGGVGFVKIEFSPDGGLSWIAVTNGLDATADYYLWTIPWVNSQNCKIRIIDEADSRIVGSSGLFTISTSSGVSDQSLTPRPFVAVSNHPNPFNPATTIRYELGMPGRATLAVYNALGQRVSRHDLGQKERGAHEFVFDGSRLTSGVYFYRVDTGGVAVTGKMMLMR
jgi:hypothetical protein